MILLDTDHLSVVINSQANGHGALIVRLEDANDFLAATIIVGKGPYSPGDDP